MAVELVWPPTVDTVNLLEKQIIAQIGISESNRRNSDVDLILENGATNYVPGANVKHNLDAGIFCVELFDGHIEVCVNNVADEHNLQFPRDHVRKVSNSDRNIVDHATDVHANFRELGSFIRKVEALWPPLAKTHP